MMTRDDVDGCVRALHAGAMSENEYIRRTAPYWNRIAGGIYRRWRKKLGTSAGREDVEQEFLLLVVHHSKLWDPSYGVPPTRYIVPNAVNRTTREIHRVRGAGVHGNPCKRPSRPEVTFSRFARPSGEDGAEIDPCDFAPTQPAQESDFALSEFYDYAEEESETREESIVIQGLRSFEGDTDAVADTICGSFTLRTMFGVKNLAQARSRVDEVVQSFVSAA